MSQYLIFFILVPLLGFLISLVPSKKNEKLIYSISLLTLCLHAVILALVGFEWFTSSESSIINSYLPFYVYQTSSFKIDLFVDKLSMVYSSVAVILSILIAIFSRFYMHRDPGFKRFYSIILLFFMGLNLVIFSGNFEVLFVGWEILGISSFFLIGFYRERYLPTKNALKVVSIYRLSDILLLAGIWMCHHAFERNINFFELTHEKELMVILAENTNLLFLIPGMFMLVAFIKSAQFPFSSWMPRAMEGPTTSSAIFYGSLSVHIGLFLMMRLSPLWIDNNLIKMLLAIFGLLTIITSASTAAVQSAVKTQIGYASITQIGLMFIELSLGFENLVLFHFAGNAFLRTYQLLVSPSVLHYLIHSQFFHFIKPTDTMSNNFLGRIQKTIFILSIKEWNMDRFQFKYLWNPFKVIGNFLQFLNNKAMYIFTLLLLLFAVIAKTMNSDWLSNIPNLFRYLLVAIGFMLVMLAFVERKSALKAWTFVFMMQVFNLMAIIYSADVPYSLIEIYLLGMIIAFVLGYYVLRQMQVLENQPDLNGFYGHVYEHPKYGLLFIVASLGMVGFPITASFIGIDIALSQLHLHDFPMLVIILLGLLFAEISVLRIYTRMFLGPHKKVYHQIAFKNS
jgi:NADH:ubiquinone oxidoreductase subunit 5 (subunit L)/multisubunit Na+/H+ antiporter MnhA subunit